MLFKGRHFEAEIIVPELNRRCRPELRKTNRSWRVDETYVRVAASGPIYTAQLIQQVRRSTFLLSVSPSHPRPRVINVDGNP